MSTNVNGTKYLIGGIYQSSTGSNTHDDEIIQSVLKLSNLGFDEILLARDFITPI